MLRRALVVCAVLATAACSKSDTKAEARSVADNPSGSAADIQPKEMKAKIPAEEGAPAPSGPDDSFELALEQPAAVAPGAAAVARITITPGKGYKMNKEFPTKLTLEPPAGITLDKATLVLDDAESFDPHKLVFAVKATPTAAGDFTIPGKIKFAVCTDATCDPKRRDVSFRVAAK